MALFDTLIWFRNFRTISHVLKLLSDATVFRHFFLMTEDELYRHKIITLLIGRIVT
jgi:hypothetical protein